MFFVVDRLDAKETDRIESAIREVICQSLGEAVKDIRIDWNHIREDEAKIVITISIEQKADPRSWRGGFAGLTSRIKGAMGERLDSVFPVLTARAA